MRAYSSEHEEIKSSLSSGKKSEIPPGGTKSCNIQTTVFAIFRLALQVKSQKLLFCNKIVYQYIN